MVPPPSQAGKFKPRKPPKKIKVGSSTTAATSTAEPAASASSKTPRPSRASSRGRGAGRGGGRGGGGRGRGRGRKRTPVPVPQGAVYFTGNQSVPSGTAAVPAAATGGSRDAPRDTAPKQQSKPTRKAKTPVKKETDEMVVGELDVAIGSTAESAQPVSKRKAQPVDASEEERDLDYSNIPSRTLLSVVDTYDSDSSLEEQMQNQTLASSSLPPTQLPFPIAQTPVGIGGQEMSRALYACQLNDDRDRRNNETIPNESHSEHGNDPPPLSPFCDTSNPQHLQQEQDSWFLWQFPTRLPNLSAKAAATGPDLVTSSSSADPQQATVEPVLSSTAPVQPASTTLDAFDDTLASAGPGRLGKILVYKSGKTVLVMGGGDGSREIRMNVTEGLSCGFVQQAVAIDTNKGNYVPLGDVKKTVVVTPDVEHEIPSA